MSGNVVLNGHLRMDGGRLTSATLSQNASGLIQGSGRVATAAAAQLSGSLSPGRLGTCGACSDDWAPAFTSVVGNITFDDVTFTGASIYVKYEINTGDELRFGRLEFSGNTTLVSISVVGAPGTIVNPFVYSQLVGLANAMSRRTVLHPQLKWSPFGCLCINDGTRGSCTLDSVAGLSIVLGFADCDGDTTRTPVCSPACQHGGTCSQLNTCICVTAPSSLFGWSDERCTTPVCRANCNGAQWGTCTAQDPLPTCVCNAPYTGETCQTLASCSPPCVNGGQCVLSGAAVACNCPAGFIGADCGGVAPVGACPTCGGHGTCSGAPQWQCVCNTGWTGSTCNIIVCAGTPSCSGNGLCAGELPSCACVSSYTGDACSQRMCVSDYCANGGTCSVEGSGAALSCACTSGWSGARCTLRVTAAPAADGGTPTWVIPVAVVLGCVVCGALAAVTVVAVRKREVLRHASQFRQQELERMGEATTKYQQMN